MAIGAVILGTWQFFNPADALISAPLVASALIAGDGVWSVPSAILALAKVDPPLCAQVRRRLHKIRVWGIGFRASSMLFHVAKVNPPLCAQVGSNPL